MQRVFCNKVQTALSIAAVSRSAECGAVLVLMPFVVLALLAFGALAIDGGNLLLSQLKLQNAVDNAARLIPLQFISGKNTPDDIRTHLTAAVQSNILASGLTLEDLSQLTVDVSYTSASIQARSRRPLYLAGAASLAVNDPQVFATTEVIVPRVNVAFLLDNSKSMQDPDVGASVNQTKLDSLQGAVARVARWFRPAYDRMGVAVFTSLGRVVVPFAENGFSPDNVSAAVLALDASGWSNIQDGMAMVRGLFGAISLSPDDLHMAIVLTDGTPNVSTLRFDPSSVDPVGLPATPAGGHAYYSLLSNHIPDIAYTLRPAPLDPRDPWGEDLTPPCIVDEPVRSGENLSGGPTDLTGCFPGGNIVALKPDGTGSFILPLVASNFRALSVLTAISEADALRDIGVAVAAFGTGDGYINDGTFPTIAADPQELSRMFLRRLSLDRRASLEGDHEFPQVGSVAARLGYQSRVSGKAIVSGSSVNAAEGIRMILGRLRFIVTK